MSLGTTNTFIGLENHKDVVLDPFFWRAVGTTIIYVVCTTLGTTLVGLVVALVMNQKFPLRGLVRSLVLFPYVAPVISVVFSWQFIFDPVNGIVMDVLVERLGLLTERVNLIGTPARPCGSLLYSVYGKTFPLPI